MDDFDLYRLDGHTLRVFVAVMETGSVTLAAERFGLSQSTVSHSLDKMRAALADPLFMRSGRGILPTERALALEPRVRQLLAAIEGLIESGEYDPSRDERPMSVAIPSPSFLTEMRRFARRLASAAPQLTLKMVRLAPRSRLLELLTEDKADLALALAADRYPAELDHCFYGSDELVVFYDPSCRGPVTTLEDYAAARHGIVDFGGNSPSLVSLALEREGIQRSIAVVAPTSSTLADLLLTSEMICTMPRALSRNAFAGLAWCPPPLNLPQIRYDLVWHKRYANSGRNRWMRDLMLECRADSCL